MCNCLLFTSFSINAYRFCFNLLVLVIHISNWQWTDAFKFKNQKANNFCKSFIPQIVHKSNFTPLILCTNLITLTFFPKYKFYIWTPILIWFVNNSGCSMRTIKLKLITYFNSAPYNSFDLTFETSYQSIKQTSIVISIIRPPTSCD